MTNAAKGVVTVIGPDDRRVALSLGFNGLAELEGLYGQSCIAVLTEFESAAMAGAPRLSDVRAILWAAMVEEAPAATLRDAGVLAAHLGVEAAFDLMRRVVKGCGLFDQQAEGEADAGNAPAGDSPASLADFHAGWCRLGLDPERFWHITPRAYAREVRAATEAKQDQFSTIAWAVWHIAALPMSKKFPSYQKFMPDDAVQSREQSADEMMAIARQINAGFNAKKDGT